MQYVMDGKIGDSAKKKQDCGKKFLSLSQENKTLKKVKKALRL